MKFSETIQYVKPRRWWFSGEDHLKRDFDGIQAYFDRWPRELNDIGTEWLTTRANIHKLVCTRRLLFLINGITSSLNEGNVPSAFAIARSLMEAVASFVYLYAILDSTIKEDEKRKRIMKLHTGMRTGRFAEGIETHDAIGVMTMVDEVDKYWKKQCIAIGQSYDKHKDSFRREYDDLCNYDHPNFQAHLIVGGFKKTKVWKPSIDTKANVKAWWSQLRVPVVFSLGILGLILLQKEGGNFPL